MIIKMRFQFNRILNQNLSSKLFARRQLTTSNFRLTNGSKNENFGSELIQEALFPLLEMPNADIFSFTFNKMHKWQNKIFTECGVTGKTFTYGQTVDGALRWAAAIGKLLPNNKNPTVAFISPNTPDYVTLLYGSLAAGCIITPINPLHTPDEVAYHLRDSNTNLLVVDPIFEQLADSSLNKLGKEIPIVVIGSSTKGRPNSQEIISDSGSPMADPIQADPKSTAFLPYSSGTTGKPKGVMISHAAITNNIAMLVNEHMAGTKPAEGEHQEIFLGLLPFFHVFGLMIALLSVASFGGKVVTLPRFDPTHFISALKKQKMTVIPVVPPLLQFISDCPQITQEDMSRVHSFMVGGAPVLETVARASKLKSPNALLQEGYGMTETLLVIGIAKGRERIGYSGQLLPNGKAKIIDLKTGELLPPNTQGELCFKVPSVMSGYHNNPAATDETIDKEGWLHTGDVAIYTEDGFFSIVDRIKELIKSKGFQISPSELEDTLRELPEIEDVGVVGMPHPKFGEAPVAFIMKSEEAEESLTEEHIHQHMRKRLAEYKQLNGGIVFVDELPKTLAGKLLRRVLKEMASKI